MTLNIPFGMAIIRSQIVGKAFRQCEIDRLASQL